MPNDLKPTPEAEALYRRWLAHLNEEFTRHQSIERRAEIVRDELYQIYLGRPHGGKLPMGLISETASAVLAETFDARNVTLAAEYRDAVDRERYTPRRPLIFFWQMFDRSALGLNVWLGTRFRCMLGQHIFAHVGRGVQIYSGVRFTYGYNLTLEDHTIIGRDAMLDDGDGPLVIPAGTTVEPGATLPPPRRTP